MTAVDDGPALEVPTIDLDDPDEKNLVALICKASSELGLLQVVNHGIPSHVIENFKKVGKEFFELPKDEKEVYGIVQGYHPGKSNIVQGKRVGFDALYHTIWPPSFIDYQFWPKNPPSYREATEEYAKHIRGVTEKVLKCLSIGLGLEEDELKKAGGGGEDLVYLLRINHYPPSVNIEDDPNLLALGMPKHTDVSLITILVTNDVPGLQALRDGQWFDVTCDPSALLIQIGDQVEIMSNGKYKAVVHRTRESMNKTRMSWPVFIDPPPNQMVGPIAKLVNSQNPPMFQPNKYADYHNQKVLEYKLVSNNN